MNKETNNIIASPATKKLNLGCGQDIRPINQGWINMDSIEQEGIQKGDIFALPLPFKENTFDLVLAKHVLEHIPHNLPNYGYTNNFLQLFVEEIWRIMKPGGLFHIEVPQGLFALIDSIDHKRTITPYTFHIFYPDDRWNFYSDCRFELAHGHEKKSLAYRFLRALLRRVFYVDIDPIRVRPFAFDLRKLPKNSAPIL
jgi:SAM-dependent methyltransferase